jgi:hypothetical protein
VRFSLICASAALAFGLALSACSGGTGTSSSSLPSAGAQALVKGGSITNSHMGTQPAPGVKRLTAGCPSMYVFCIQVTPGNPGPYVTSQSGSGELYNNAYIETLKGRIDKTFKTYFSPDPGNPTSQYIKFKGKGPKKAGPVNYSDYYCIGSSPSACDNNAYTFIIGISLNPRA